MMRAHSSLAFVCAHGPLDIVLHPDGISGFDDLARHASVIDVGGWAANVASAGHIVASKTAADRLKDRAQLPGIVAALRDAGELPPA